MSFGLLSSHKSLLSRKFSFFSKSKMHCQSLCAKQMWASKKSNAWMEKQWTQCDRISFICNNDINNPSIDNTSIQFIIQCLIVYLRLVFGCWHIDALLLFLLPMRTTIHSVLVIFSRLYLSLHLVYALRCYCRETNWLEIKLIANIEWCGSSIFAGAFFASGCSSVGGKIAGKTIQFNHSTAMSCLSNVDDRQRVIFIHLKPITWFFFCFDKRDAMPMPLFATISTYAYRIYNHCERTTGKSRLKLTWYVNLIPSSVNVAFSPNLLWVIFASSCSCYLSEKSNRAANDWMKMQNKFSHIQTNPVVISNCTRRFSTEKKTPTKKWTAECMSMVTSKHRGVE